MNGLTMSLCASSPFLINYSRTFVVVPGRDSQSVATRTGTIVSATIHAESGNAGIGRGRPPWQLSVPVVPAVPYMSHLVYAVHRSWWWTVSALPFTF